MSEKERPSKEVGGSEDEMLGMNLDVKYNSKIPQIPQNISDAQKEMEKTKKEIDRLKSWIVKKYNFTMALGILPAQTIKIFMEEEEVPKETEKFLHMYMIIPEEKFKEIGKIKQEIVKEIDAMKFKEKIWVQIKTPVDIWEACLDSKFDVAEAVSMSYPVFDTGILASLRVAEIHKSLVLQKFDKYIVSYVIGGSMVRGDVVKESDVDVFIVINDTDVKRMPRLELKERLRGIIYEYIDKAAQLAGVKKNVLNVQVYLLTDFWESVKDAHPVMFTFIRDGIPLHDRGTFLPWKALLKMGKLKPSPEAIDMFMSMGDKTVKRAKMALMDILVHDIYWSVVTPSQALLMLYGLPPPAPKTTASDMEKIFVEKEKMLEKKYINILDKIVKLYKEYEHEKLKEIKGAEIDELIKGTEDYLKRLDELRVQIDKRAQEQTVEQIYKDVFELLKTLVGKKSEAEIIKEFENKFVKKGQFSPNDLRILNDVAKARKEFKKGKLNAHTINDARKNASILINDLIEFNQRCEIATRKEEGLKEKVKRE